MRQRSVEAVAEALNRRRVRYLLAGGLAVVAHGYLRTTQDVDIVLDLEADNVGCALEAFRELGYRPVLPVALEDFADPDKREEWAQTKQATVFRLSSVDHPLTPVDLFVESPFEFSEAYERSKTECLRPDGVQATFVGLEDVIAMKQRAGRPQDLADIAQLERIRERLRDEEAGRDR